MFPGINPREMQKAMKRLGIQQEEIEAEIVIIRTPTKNLIIQKPHVSKVNMMGQETFQVVGDVIEVEANSKETNKEDITTIMDQTGCTKEEALSALEQSNGNLVEAILKLQNK